MKTFVRVSMLTWETAAARAERGSPMDGFAERSESLSDDAGPRSRAYSVRSDLDWIREHEGFDESIVRLAATHD